MPNLDPFQESSHEIEALVADAQKLLHAYQVLQSENTQLRMIITDQNQRFTHAQNRLLGLVQQLPSLMLDPLIHRDSELPHHD